MPVILVEHAPDIEFEVYSLPTTRSVPVHHVALSYLRTWAVGTVHGVQRVYATHLKSLRPSDRPKWFRNRRVRTVQLTNLADSDIQALGALGLIDALVVTASLEQTRMASLVENELEDFDAAAKTLQEAGIAVPKTWRKRYLPHAQKEARATYARRYAPDKRT